MKYEIRLSGTGGQGLVLAGIILGEAAAIHENFYALQRQSYGPEARGGASRSDVIISDEEIDYVVIDESDILLAMSQEAYDKYASKVKKGGILLIDTSLVCATLLDRDVRFFSIDFTKSARSLFNTRIVANIIALGTIIGVLGIISENSVKKVLQERIPAKLLSINLRAFEQGIAFSKGE